jgi:hypothetical protein
VAARELHYLPAGSTDVTTRVRASVWAPAPGGRWVVPLDAGPRRIILVMRRHGVWHETR